MGVLGATVRETNIVGKANTVYKLCLLPHQLLVGTIPHGLVYRPISWRHFLSWDFLFLDMARCVSHGQKPASSGGACQQCGPAG